MFGQLAEAQKNAEEIKQRIKELESRKGQELTGNFLRK